MHAAQLAAGHAQLARLLRAAGEQHGVELVAQLRDVQIAADVDAGLEVHALGLELAKAEVEHLLLQLEVGDAVAQQPTDAVVLLEHDDGVAEAAQLLRRGEPRGPGADDRDAEARVGRAGGRGTTHPSENDLSAIACSMLRIATGCSIRPSTHADSQGAGQSRPVSSGKLFVACSASDASRQRPAGRARSTRG